MNRKTNLLEFVELPVGLVRGLIRTRLREDLLKARVDGFLMELVAVVLQPFDEHLDGAFGLEGEEREAVRNVAPLLEVM